MIRSSGFNRNMGCIEIVVINQSFLWKNLFNRNMGCIEMLLYQLATLWQFRLIETWDVLKFGRLVEDVDHELV